HEVTAAILRPAGLARLAAEGRFLAEAPHLDALRRHAEAHQVVADGCRAAFAEREVVLRRAALVAVPLDEDARRRPPRQPGRIALERRAAVLAQHVLVVVEEDVAQRALGVQLVERLAAEQLLLAERRRGARGRRGRRRSRRAWRGGGGGGRPGGRGRRGGWRDPVMARPADDGGGSESGQRGEVSWHGLSPGRSGRPP